jgi:ABC-2 type transport system ATP-binding protein
MNTVIRTEHLGKKFGRVQALSELNLDVPLGAIYSLVGPNGAGKTTAIKILMNIFPATSGHAEVLGTASSRLAGRSFTSIGYVSENQQLPDWMQVGDFFAYLRPFYPSWDKDLENAMVREFQIPLDRQLGKLSRGMRMKAALASSLAYRPKLIVLDEPFGGLDPLVRDELVEGLLGQASESTIFISSHDLAEIENLASHVGYLEQGHLRVSEQMTTLSERFREVELTLAESWTPREDLPNTWMHVSSSAAVLRFIDTRFNEERTKAEISRLFGNPRHVSFTPMSLRSIFLALAKAGRTSA